MQPCKAQENLSTEQWKSSGRQELWGWKKSQDEGEASVDRQQTSAEVCDLFYLNLCDVPVNIIEIVAIFTYETAALAQRILLPGTPLVLWHGGNHVFAKSTMMNPYGKPF